ncbi:hypothetical protein C4J88_4173 [Pseudomonas sp. R4-39-08]|uniref:DUF6252 family protein n=1 Tax=Pseudomonas sp. R4-39-08 TaxID=1173288 RepID=UPI000F56E761|nr:DUF6252 family protein [Pseudomonas sp. R4-39-08]AZF38927.1 hypothetical protein C4J88_4173 [Pseudomonas sp. R4-39-08]
MYSLTSNKTLFVKGVIGCNISITPLPFTSESVTLQDASATQFVIVGHDRSWGRVVLIYLDKDISCGTFNIGRGEKVFAYYYHRYSEFGWNYYAESGTFTLSSVDFANSLLEGTFNFNAPGMEEGEPEMKITNGVVNLTGPSR